MTDLEAGYLSAKSKKQYIYEQSLATGLSYEEIYKLLQNGGCTMGTVPKHYSPPSTPPVNQIKKAKPEAKEKPVEGLSETEAQYQRNIRSLMDEVKQLRAELDQASCKVVSPGAAVPEEFQAQREKLKAQLDEVKVQCEELRAQALKWKQKYEDCARYASDLEASNKKLCDHVEQLNNTNRAEPAPTMSPMERAMLNMAMKIFGGDPE